MRPGVIFTLRNRHSGVNINQQNRLHPYYLVYISDDGQVIIIDRMADVMKLADGSKFSPQLIENKLKFSPYIMDAVVIGQDQPYISAMISIDSGNVGKWAENNQIAYTTFTDLSQKREVYDLIADEVVKTNQTLPKVAKVKKFVLLYKELDADDEELTRTRKVRRKFVLQRYKELVDALYGDQEELDIEADIRKENGIAVAGVVGETGPVG